MLRMILCFGIDVIRGIMKAVGMFRIRFMDIRIEAALERW